eukprot:TRINITY_DN19593_c0_g1_i2.p1 TRINITY_DN19593_c0_g1~~TRINITY_DN19593_c0_g1_i2.p1  ORF type:complete len:554 (-),score=167.55 TRINITY_DN19593_c0_g1_i2:47-1537(-)
MGEVRGLKGFMNNAKILVSQGPPINNEWIVHLEPGFNVTTLEEEQVEQPWSILQVDDVNNMIVLDCPESFIIHALNTTYMKSVAAYVERNRVFSTTAVPWNIDRIDQRSLPLDGRYDTMDTDGTGVDIYIIDTGIRTTHRIFGGRATWEYSAFPDSTDCNGHGTHVAGTAGGSIYGVARGANLKAVRVMSCEGSGSTFNIIGGIKHVIKRKRETRRPAVISMSLGGAASETLDDAVREAIAAGIVVVAAAGNDGRDACAVSPARVPAVITVGASDKFDKRPAFSNYGKCVDISAGGVDIVSSWNTGDEALNNLQGTSMATPHVSGVAALILEKYPNYSPRDVHSFILSSATSDHLFNLRTSPNRLLFFGDFGASLQSSSFQRDFECENCITEPGHVKKGEQVRHPGMMGYFTARAPKVMHAVLRTEDDSLEFDADVFLMRRDIDYLRTSDWKLVATSSGMGSEEEILWDLEEGEAEFAWIVLGYRGEGAYTLHFTQ